MRIVTSRILPTGPWYRPRAVVGAVLLLALVAFFATAVIHHVQIAMDGWYGFAASGMVGRVYNSLLQPLIEKFDIGLDPNASALHYLWVLAGVEALITLSVLLAKRWKPFALLVMAVYMVVATTAVLLITPGVGNRLFENIDCGCTNEQVLELFGPGNIMALLIRNVVMVTACLWLALQWRRPSA